MTERQLAALVFADVVAFSSLVQKDEAAAMAALNALRRDMLPRQARRNNGVVVDQAGDGFLVSFPSAVDSVRFALAMQEEAGRGSLALRIGVHIGEVVLNEAKPFGDTVNIAARVQAIAPPGGTALSDEAYLQVRNILDLSWKDCGLHDLKNIERRVRIWHVLTEATQRTPARPVEVAQPRPVVAVLPFTAFDDGNLPPFFLEGVTEDVIFALSQLAGIDVLARNSSFAYRGKTLLPAQIARDLGASHFVIGNLRWDDAFVQITLQLVETESGVQIWTERYHRKKGDALLLQADIADDMAVALQVGLANRARRIQSDTKGIDADAYEHFLEGRQLLYRTNDRDNRLARKALRRATELQPGFAEALSYLAMTHVMDHVNSWVRRSDNLEIADGFAQSALEAGPESSQAHLAYATVGLWLRDHARAITHSRRATELDPSYAHAHFHLGSSLTYAGQPELALPCYDRAVQLDPKHPEVFLHWIALAHFYNGDLARALAITRQRLRANPNSDVAHLLAAACFGGLGQAEEARAEWAELYEVAPDFDVRRKFEILPFADPDALRVITDPLDRAGLPWREASG